MHELVNRFVDGNLRPAVLQELSARRSYPVEQRRLVRLADWVQRMLGVQPGWTDPIGGLPPLDSTNTGFPPWHR